MPKTLPSVDEWLSTLAKDALPVECWEHFYLLAFVMCGVAYVKVGRTEFDSVAMRNWKVKSLSGETMVFTILCFFPRAVPKFKTRLGPAQYTAATIESVMKSILSATTGGAPRDILVDGNRSTETFACTPSHAMNAVSRCLASMHVMHAYGVTSKEHARGYLWRRTNDTRAYANSKGSSRVVSLPPPVPELMLSDSMIENGLEDAPLESSAIVGPPPIVAPQPTVDSYGMVLQAPLHTDADRRRFVVSLENTLNKDKSSVTSVYAKKEETTTSVLFVRAGTAPKRPITSHSAYCSRLLNHTFGERKANTMWEDCVLGGNRVLVGRMLEETISSYEPIWSTAAVSPADGEACQDQLATSVAEEVREDALATKPRPLQARRLGSKTAVASEQGSICQDDMPTQRDFPVEMDKASGSDDNTIPGSPPCLKRAKTIDLSLLAFRDTWSDVRSLGDSLEGESHNQDERFEPSTQEFQRMVATPVSQGY